jgi:hypothetical protein
MQAPAALHRFVPRHETLFVGLDGLPAHSDDASSPLATVLRVLRLADSDTEAMRAALATAVGELGALPPEAQYVWRRAAHYLILLVRHKRTVDEQDALSQALADAIAGERHVNRYPAGQDRGAHRRTGELDGGSATRRTIAGRTRAVGRGPEPNQDSGPRVLCAVAAAPGYRFGSASGSLWLSSHSNSSGVL